MPVGRRIETGNTVSKGESGEKCLLRHKLKLNVRVCVAFEFHKPGYFFYLKT